MRLHDEFKDWGKNVFTDFVHVESMRIRTRTPNKFKDEDKVRDKLTIRLCLDVDIGEVGIELDTIPNQLGIGNSFQCQSYCLDVQRIHLSSLPISTALPGHLPDQWRHRAWGTRRGSSTPAMGELGPVNGWPLTTARPSTPRPPMPGGGRRSA